VDVTLTTDEEPDQARTGRVSASECPTDLKPGEKVRVRFVMGVMVGVKR
jgi:hypothetical protein